MPEIPPTDAFSLERIRQDVADVLQIDPQELDDDELLVYQGMDSIRLMTLVQRWRDKGTEVTFVDLAGEATIKRWRDQLGTP
ncbi:MULTISPECIES: phosphopantetheine-binding protein [unclassified Streptomyces]|uniref:phosphopantetheine-binding protein n=1 Tax=Streptomycetaceae TaxID=2062 RepID=UPI002E77855B|nr:MULTISPECIES: phosphopantetheine-binding protein [unclassified Streptomyces]MED7955358.1 phosphopantetheine-binding protein [Streptomyces sp. BE303]MEE1827831.1 phosphopantetheine-binding protein [Streptomyces sp. BE20]